MRILVAVEPADFRCGIDGLARLCKARLREDPFSGALFVFRNRKGTAVKALAYDGQGFCTNVFRPDVFASGHRKPARR